MNFLIIQDAHPLYCKKFFVTVYSSIKYSTSNFFLSVISIQLGISSESQSIFSLLEKKGKRNSFTRKYMKNEKIEEKK